MVVFCIFYQSINYIIIFLLKNNNNKIPFSFAAVGNSCIIKDQLIKEKE